MGQYPAGLTQAGFDRAFDDLGPDYLTCEECDETLEPPEMPDPADYISKRHAATIMRVMVRIEQQASRAYDEGRIEDSRSLSRLFGTTFFRQFECGFGELGA